MEFGGNLVLQPYALVQHTFTVEPGVGQMFSGLQAAEIAAAADQDGMLSELH
jgi:hypothetical protein